MKKLISLFCVFALLAALAVPASAATNKETVLDALRKPLEDSGLEHTFAVVGRLVIVTTWFEGASVTAQLAKTNENSKTAWNSAVEAMRTMQASMQNVLNNGGMSDYVAVLILVAENNHDRMLCAVMDGELAVDVAAGIDLIRGA